MQLNSMENRLKGKEEMRKKFESVQNLLLLSKTRYTDLVERLEGLIAANNKETVLNELAKLIG